MRTTNVAALLSALLASACDPGDGIPGTHGGAQAPGAEDAALGADGARGGADAGLPRWADAGGAGAPDAMNDDGATTGGDTAGGKDGGHGGGSDGGLPRGEDALPLEDAEGLDALTDAGGAPDTTSTEDGAGPDGAAPDAAAPTPDATPDGGPEDASGPGALDATQDASSPEDTGPPPWEPAPIPPVSEEPPPACQAAIDDPWYFQFLDNLCDEKVWPSTQDRDRACPVADDSPQMVLQDGSVVTYHPSADPIVWDTTSLTALVPAQMNIAVILIKRVGGVPHYRYLGHAAETPFQPWSTTKVLAAANAAASLRVASQYQVGLTAKTGSYQVGDLVSTLCKYDDNPFSSNALGAWFHDVGGREKANGLIHDLWLERPATESFGGNYGDAAAPAGYTFKEASGAQVTITPDKTSGIANNLSAHTMAEAVKRLVLHREEPDQRLPGIQWLDLRVLLFGAESSTKYGAWGGMTQDTSIYLQMAHDIDYIEERSHGEWVIFSKLGLGTKGQFTHMGYACFPVLDPSGAPVPGWGRELVIAAHLPSGGATWDERDRILQRTYRKIVVRVVDGRL